jgi:NitT/TauT family transport system substrate-binding protein
LRQILSSGGGTLPLVVAGEVDVIFGSASPAVMNAVIKGARIRIVAGREKATPGCSSTSQLYGNRKVFPNGLGDLGVLRGKRVAYEGPTHFSEFTLYMILRSGGLRLEDVQLVRLDQPERLTAVIAGKVDAAISSDFDRRLEALSENIVAGAGFADASPNHQTTFVVFGPRLLDGEVEVGARFLASYLRGNREFAGGKTPRYLEHVAQALKMDPTMARTACRDLFTLDGRIDQASLQRYVDWAVERKYCPRRLEVAELIDTRFIDRAAALSPGPGGPQA